MNKIKYPYIKIFQSNANYIKSINKSIVKKEMSFGKKCEVLENQLKKFFKVKYVVLTTNGTSALMMAALAMKIKARDKIICNNAAWIAAINPFLILKAKIYLVDTLKDSEKVNFFELNKLIKKTKPKLVILVHLNGQPNYDEEFEKLKIKYKFKVIEDAAQAFLAADKKKKKWGTKFEIGCFSLSITKPMHMIYGGCCVTNDKNIYDKLYAIRNNGMFAKDTFDHLSKTIGLNFKPSDIHASVGIENLKNSNKIKKKIIENHKVYKDRLRNKNLKFINLEGKNSVPNFAQIITKNRKKFMNFFKKNNLGVSKGLKCLSDNASLKYNSSMLKNSKNLSEMLVRLPFGAGYTQNEIKKICKILNKY